MRKWGSLLLALLLTVALLAIPVHAADATVSSSSADAKPGDEIAVTVSLNDNPGLTVLRIQVTYDRSVMTLIGVDDAGKLGDNLHSKELDSFPYVLYWKNSMAKQNFTEDGVLATLRFKVAQDALATESAVELTVAKTDALNADLDPVPLTMSIGTIKIACSHSKTAWRIKTPSTCVKQGEEVLACVGCGKETDSRPAELAPHTADWIVDKEATLKETGLRHGTCTVCNQAVEEVIPKQVLEFTTTADDGATVMVSAREPLPGNAVLTVNNVLYDLSGEQVIAWEDAITHLAPGKEMVALYYMELSCEGEPCRTIEPMTVTVIPPKDKAEFEEWQWMFDNALFETFVEKDGSVSFATLSLKNSYALVAKPATRNGRLWLVIAAATLIVAVITIAIIRISRLKHTKRERTKE